MGSLNPLAAGNERASHGEADKWPVRPGRDTVCGKTHMAPGPSTRGQIALAALGSGWE